jgi:hypothetical protein
MLKKSCSIAAVVLLGLFAGYVWLLWGKIEAVPAIILAGMGSFGLVMVVSQVKAVIFGSGDAGALKKAEEGLPLEDGKEEAVWGPIEPLGAPLEAPFSGRTCVAYEYDAKDPTTVDSEGDTRPAASAIAGFALAPSVIRSSRGDVHLLGFSLLTEFPETTFEGPEAFERAMRHASSSEFTEMGITKIGAMFSLMDDAMTDDDGAVRKDMRTKGSSAAELAGCALKEKVIALGETVTAIGIWDAARGGLVPKHRGKSVIVRLLPGGGAAMVAHSQKRPWGILAFSLVWAGGIHAAIYFILKLAPK